MRIPLPGWTEAIDVNCLVDGYEFSHNQIATSLSGPQSSRVGVNQDHRAGTLCFYSICENTSLLHRVQTTFTQPLYARFRVHGLFGFRSFAEICETKDKS